MLPMPPEQLVVTAERTVRGWVAHCAALGISCEGPTEAAARAEVVAAITALYGAEPVAEVDARPPEPPRVRQVRLRGPG